MRIARYVLAAALPCLAIAAADPRPNFTGVWKHRTDGGSTVYTVTQSDADLTVAYRSDYSAGALAGALMGTRTYTLDGVERENGTAKGPTRWITVSWQDD